MKFCPWLKFSIEILIWIEVSVKIWILIQVSVKTQILIKISTWIILIMIKVPILIIISIEILILVESISLGNIRGDGKLLIFLSSFLLPGIFRRCTWYLWRGLYWVPGPCLFPSYWLFCLVQLLLNWLPCELLFVNCWTNWKQVAAV